MPIEKCEKVCYTIDTKGKKINPEKDVRDQKGHRAVFERKV